MKLFSRMIAVLLLVQFTADNLQAQPERFVAGTHYDIIDNPPGTLDPDSIEVVEYFWYGCPGCYQFEPLFTAWIERQADDVSILRLPAIPGELSKVHAGAYYTAQYLGELENLHSKLFNAMHVERMQLKNQQELAEFFESKGIAREEFDKAYDSFFVKSRLQQAQNTARKFGVRSTPSLVVNGKYRVLLSRDTLAILDFLVEKERR